MRATKKLERCEENCKYNSHGICAFGLRNSIGCFLDPDVKIKAGVILEERLKINTVGIMKQVMKGTLDE